MEKKINPSPSKWKEISMLFPATFTRITPKKPMYYYYRGLYKRLLENRGEACEDFHTALGMDYEPAKYFIDNYCNR